MRNHHCTLTSSYSFNLGPSVTHVSYYHCVFFHIPHIQSFLPLCHLLIVIWAYFSWRASGNICSPTQSSNLFFFTFKFFASLWSWIYCLGGMFRIRTKILRSLLYLHVDEKQPLFTCSWRNLYSMYTQNSNVYIE